MEIKKRLQKPYTEKERINFIVQQNHRNGFEIRETDEELQAWGYTQEEIEEQQKQARNAEIDSKIKELNEMAIPDMLQNNIENIKLYNEVIDGLKYSKN